MGSWRQAGRECMKMDPAIACKAPATYRGQQERYDPEVVARVAAL
jgi:hypothetical protein